MSGAAYESPLSNRYASKEMNFIFSSRFKYRTWRELWTALAEVQKELGLPISDEQIQELTLHIDDVDEQKAIEYEKIMHHDVMAHIHAYGDQCPSAKSIIHLGSTSCFVTDNTDLIQIRQGINILIPKLKKVIEQLCDFANQYASQPCLGFTHFQPAQLTTVGKRACLWIQDFLMDFQELQYRLKNLRFLGAKGATGTQASFLALFDQDKNKVKEMDRLIAKKMGFDCIFTISGQTYTRKQDVQILTTLAGLAVSAHKFGTDLRLLSHLKEIEEPFFENQVGSSAMPYKRNPILAERICSLSRYLISLAENPTYTAATQWLERTLDDSANRRICLPEAFLTCDAILNLLDKVSKGLIVNPGVIERHIKEELPFMATENILMAAVKIGGDRQKLHERLRQLSIEEGQRLKEQGNQPELLHRIISDPAFKLTKNDLEKILNINEFIGRASDQVKEFLDLEVTKTIGGYDDR